MSDSLEQKMLGALSNLLGKYTELNLLIDLMVQKVDDSDSITGEMPKLERQKLELVQLESDSQELRVEYRNQMPTSSTAVREQTDKAAMLLTRMIENLAALENRMKESHRKLSPSVNRAIRANQMQNAYQQ